MTLLSKCVAIADKTTRKIGVQSDVRFRSYLDSDGSGGSASFDPWVLRTAVVNKTQKLVKGFDGQMIVCTAVVTFVDPTPVKQFDEIVLADGSTGTIVGVADAPMDASNQTLITTFYLG